MPEVPPANEAPPPVSPTDPSSLLSSSRAPDYNIIFSDIHRARLGNGTVSVTFSRTTHPPGLQTLNNIIEEQCDIVMSWTQIKMVAMNLSAIVTAIEEEIGPISIPSAFRISHEANLAVVRSLGYPPPARGTAAGDAQD
jgi:hypothetical protein